MPVYNTQYKGVCCRGTRWLTLPSCSLYVRKVLQLYIINCPLMSALPGMILIHTFLNYESSLSITVQSPPRIGNLYIYCIYFCIGFIKAPFLFFKKNNCISYSFGIFLKIMNTMDKYVLLPSLDHVIGYLSFLGCFEILIASKSKRILWLDESHQHRNIYLGLLILFFFTSSSNLKRRKTI